MRSMAKASISFGLVTVPVKVYACVESEVNVSFNMLHGKCGQRVKQQYVCPTHDNAPVEGDDIVKGYEHEPGKFVQFTSAEIKALGEVGDGRIEIKEFIPVGEVPHQFLDKVYYLAPDKAGERPYGLLARALEETGRGGVGQYAARGKQHLVMVRGYDGRLLLEHLRYADQVRSMADLKVPEAKIRDDELEMAKLLVIQAATETFEPQNYVDTSRERVLEAIKRKVAGGDVVEPNEEKPAETTTDLMAALRASLERKAA